MTDCKAATCPSKALRPAPVRETRTRRRRFVTNRSIVTYPASSKTENCFDKAESDRPRRSRTNEKSAQSVEAKSATMDNRVLGWMISSNLASLTKHRGAAQHVDAP